MNRICFVSKKEEAQRLGLNTHFLRRTTFFWNKHALVLLEQIAVYWLFSLDS